MKKAGKVKVMLPETGLEGDEGAREVERVRLVVVAGGLVGTDGFWR